LYRIFDRSNGGIEILQGIQGSFFLLEIIHAWKVTLLHDSILVQLNIAVIYEMDKGGSILLFV
jgi:hypothetical protein